MKGAENKIIDSYHLGLGSVTSWSRFSQSSDPNACKRQ
jgi:hypothetical protein